MIDRIQTGRLVEMLDVFPVVAVIGARQVGKSTLVQSSEIGSGRRYCSLDDFATLGMAQTDPFALLRSADRVTIDEAQRVPDLLLAVKREVDQDRSPGRFLLTGSADLRFTAELARVLAGRVGVMRLRPLSWREKEGRVEQPALADWLTSPELSEVEACLNRVPLPPLVEEDLFVGGYPPAVTASSRRATDLWLASFRTMYLEREVWQVSQVAHLSEFSRLLELSATRTAQLLNQAALAREVGLTAPTLGRYLTLMEATFQIDRIRPFHANLGKRLVKSPKLFWTDTGVASFLLGLRTWEEAQSAGYAGSLFETFVMLELASAIEAHLPSPRLFFLRDHSGMEIDAVIMHGQRLLPCEIKAAATVRPSDARHLHAFLDAEPRARFGLVIYTGDAVRQLSANVLAVPVGALLA